MLKNKLIMKKIRNIVILLMVIVIMIGAYANIRRSKAENVIELTMSVVDKSGELGEQEIRVGATERKDGTYLLDLPTAVNGNIVSKYYTQRGEEIEIDFENNVAVIELPEEEVNDKAIQLEVDYDTRQVEKDGKTVTLYNKEFKQDDYVFITGYMPLNTRLEAKEIDIGQLTNVKVPDEDYEMYKAYDFTLIETVTKVVEGAEAQAGTGAEVQTEENQGEQAEVQDGTGTQENGAETQTEVQQEEVQENGTGPQTGMSAENQEVQQQEAQLTEQPVEQVAPNENVSEAGNATQAENTEPNENTAQVENTEPNENTAQAENIEPNENAAGNVSEVTEEIEYDPTVYGEQINVRIAFSELERESRVYGLTENNEIEEISSASINGVEKLKTEKLEKYLVTLEKTENIGWKVIDSETDVVNEGTSTMIVEGPEDILTEEWVKVLVNGEDKTNEVTKAISDKKTVGERIQYTILVTGLPKENVNQVKIQLEQPTSTLTNGISTMSANGEVEEPVLLAANAYNTLITTKNEFDTGYFLGNSEIERKYVQSIDFVSSTRNADDTAWDVSAAQDGSILAWYESTRLEDYDDGTTFLVYDVTIGSDSEIYANQDSRYLFYDIDWPYNEITADPSMVIDLELLNTSNVTNMRGMFKQCGYYDLKTLNLGPNFDTSNVTDMAYMFDKCGTYGTVEDDFDLGDKFDTSKVTNMSYMFRYFGQDWTAFNLGSKFDTSKVTNMSAMFEEFTCESLDLGDKFNTSNVTNMSRMFYRLGCGSSLDLGNNFDTSKVTNMSEMFFQACSDLQTLDLGDKFDTSEVTNMSYMFWMFAGNELRTLDLGDKFDTSKVTNMNSMFSSCGEGGITTLDLGPKFTKIASSHSNFITDCGDSPNIYVSEDIYYSSSLFKTGKDSTTTIRVPTGATLIAEYESVTEPGTLMATNGETSRTSPFLGNTALQRQYIEKITFVDSTSGANSTAWDVSVEQNGSIMAWYTGSNPYQVYIGTDSGEIIANQNSSYLFNGIGYASTCTATDVIVNLDLLNTSQVNNMMFMFDNCGREAMTNLDLGDNFDTSKVTNMLGMFQFCGMNAMTSLDLGANFDTSNVTDMRYMFNNCGTNEMTSFSLGDKFNTSQVTDMRYMFSNCGYKMISFGLGDKFDTSNVTNMEGMFWRCGEGNLAMLDLGDKFDTSNVTNMREMFYYCGSGSLNVLDLGPEFKNIATEHTNFITNCGHSNTTIYAHEDIYQTQKLFKLNANSTTTVSGVLGRINPIYREATLRATNTETAMTSPFLGNTALQRQYIEKVTFVDSTAGANSTAWDVSDTQDGSIMAWYTGNNPYQVYIGTDSGEIKANPDSSRLFSNIGFFNTCTATDVIVNIDLLNISNVTNMDSMFFQCGFSTMTSLDLGDNFDTSNVTNMSYMFTMCGYKAMTSLDLGDKFDTSQVTEMKSMFYNCGYTAMTSLDLGENFDTSNVTDMNFMFNSCGNKAMTTLNLGPNFNTNSVTDMSNMFYGCGYTAMTSLDLGDNFDTSSVTDMQYMFYGCGAIAMTSLDLGDKFDTSNVTNMTNMFYSCGYTSMTSLDLGDKFDTSEVTKMNYMFHMCGEESMTTLDLGPAFTKIASQNTNFAKCLINKN